MTKIDDKRLQIFGEHILKLREGKNLSQDDVSEGCRLTKATISVIENGKRNFTFSTLIALAKGLGVQPKELLDLDLKLHLDDWLIDNSHIETQLRRKKILQIQFRLVPSCFNYE